MMWITIWKVWWLLQKHLPRHVLHSLIKSCLLFLPHPAGFALQPYKGAQKPTPMEVMKAQASRLAEDPANLKAPPKMEIPTMDGKRQMTRPHKLKHRDMNVLTPSGF